MVFGAFFRILKKIVKIKKRRSLSRRKKLRKSLKKQKLRNSIHRRKRFFHKPRIKNQKRRIEKKQGHLRKRKKLKKKVVKKTRARHLKKRQMKKARQSLALKTKNAEKKDSTNLVGEITHYFPNVHAAVVRCKKPVSIGDAIHIRGKLTDFRQTVGSIQIDRVPITTAKKGQEIGLEVFRDVKPGDLIYRSVA